MGWGGGGGGIEDFRKKNVQRYLGKKKLFKIQLGKGLFRSLFEKKVC